jgi:hypothetical protein
MMPRVTCSGGMNMNVGNMNMGEMSMANMGEMSMANMGGMSNVQFGLPGSPRSAAAESTVGGQSHRPSCIMRPPGSPRRVPNDTIGAGIPSDIMNLLGISPSPGSGGGMSI